MSTTLTHGYKKPANPDTGDTFWADLATDIQLMNDHVHDGTTGTVLPAVAQTVSSGSWAAVSGQAGTYSQTVTMPAALNFGQVSVEFRLGSVTGTKIYPTVVGINATSYTVFTNDNTQTFIALYSS